jgi:hypothetical protein
MHHYVICINNDGYTASLERRKIYTALEDVVAEKHGHIRVVDESGEDYLYPQELFLVVDFPQHIQQALVEV